MSIPPKVVTSTHVAALVPSDVVARIGPTIVRRLTIEFCASAAQLIHAVVTGHTNVIILDPTIVRPDTHARIIETVDAAGPGLVLYLPLTTDAARLVLDTTIRLRVECVFHTPNERLAHVMPQVCQVSTPSMPSLVLTEIAHAVTALPPMLGMVVVGMFGWLPIPDSVAEFAASARIERRSLERHLTAAGLTGPKRLIACARLARTWHDLQDHRLHIAIVAERNGFASIRTFTEQYHRLLGGSPRTFRTKHAAREFAARLATALRDIEPATLASAG